MHGNRVVCGPNFACFCLLAPLTALFRCFCSLRSNGSTRTFSHSLAPLSSATSTKPSAVIVRTHIHSHVFESSCRQRIRCLNSHILSTRLKAVNSQPVRLFGSERTFSLVRASRFVRAQARDPHTIQKDAQRTKRARFNARSG